MRRAATTAMKATARTTAKRMKAMVRGSRGWLAIAASRGRPPRLKPEVRPEDTDDPAKGGHEDLGGILGEARPGGSDGVPKDRHRDGVYRDGKAGRADHRHPIPLPVHPRDSHVRRSLSMPEAPSNGPTKDTSSNIHTSVAGTAAPTMTHHTRT